MSHRPARTSHEKKPRSVKEAKKLQEEKNAKRRKQYKGKRGAAGADECIGNMEFGIYIV